MINDKNSWQILDSFLKDGYDKLNVGGGNKNLKGFVNIDFVPHGSSVKREVVANALNLSFIKDGSFKHIHSNHFIEHMSHDQLISQLHEYYRMLRKGGLLSLRCPNALGVCYGFWFEVIPETKREEFIDLGYPTDEDFYNPLDDWYHKNFYGFLHWLYGDMGNIKNQHLNQLTPTKLKKAVENSGFEVLKMTEPETSNIILVAKRND